MAHPLVNRDRRSRRRVALRPLFLLAAALGAPLLTASELRAGEPRAETVGSLNRARELFRAGVDQQKTENWDRALDLYRQSLGEAPTWRATMNAAFCLDKLGRYDEALEMSEDIITLFATELPAAERSSVQAAIKGLLQKVGSFEIKANVIGAISVDGRLLGQLPRGLSRLVRVNPGKHTVRIFKDGFQPFVSTEEVAAGKTVTVTALLDPLIPEPPAHPQPAPQSIRPFLSAFAGLVIAGSLGSTAESDDAEIDSHPPATGFLGGIRGGYRFPAGFAIEISLGYLTASSTVRRSWRKNNPDSVPVDGHPPVLPKYNLTDPLQLSGPVFGAGVSYLTSLNEHLDAHLRTTVGLVAFRALDPIEGTVCINSCSAQSRDDFAEITVKNKYQPLYSTSGFIIPEVGARATWGGFHAGLSLGLLVLTSSGPSFDQRSVGASSSKTTCAKTLTSITVACIPHRPLWTTEKEDPLKKNELAYGSFAALWAPQATVEYSF
ncbi:MAG: PEGA domain-containing protein [Byssovorax sp.]